MVNSARSTAAIDRILSVDHPEWTANSRTQRRLQLDYSNPAVWDRENLSLEHVNIKAIWRSGYYKALGMLPAEDADDLDCTSTTLRSLIKKGIIVGVKNAPTEEEEEDWSIGDVGDEDEVDEVEVVVEPGVDNDELGEMIPDPDKSYDPFFLIDGKVYKTTCLKSISSNTKLSKDRLRRVQGKSKYPGDKDASEDNNLFLFVGDPVLIMHPKDGPFVANVKSMKKANIPVHQIKIPNDHTELKNNELALQRIDTGLLEGRLYWKGTLSGEVINLVSDACLPIKPSIELNPPDGMTKYYFDMGLLQDMGVHLQLSTPASNQSDPGPSTPALKKCCLQCGKSILLSEMRCHVAKHILKGDLADDNTCGFCGNDTCSVTLKKT